VLLSGNSRRGELESLPRAQPMSETHSETSSAASASASVRIIAIAVLFGCIYYASSVVITLICSILIASVLDPGVRMMELYRIPRWLASLIMVLLMLTVAYLAIYVIYDRAQAFFREMPRLVERLKQITANTSVDGAQHPAEHADHACRLPRRRTCPPCGCSRNPPTCNSCCGASDRFTPLPSP
jgi:hypothetical protein